ncbi:MAG: esterase family protein [Acidobacteriota bacterium]|nr:esterase family protein [Acidobacteriota bacterium]
MDETQQQEMGGGGGEFLGAAEVPAPPPPLDLPAPAGPLAAEWVPGRLHVLGPLEVPGFRARHVRVYLPSTFSPAVPRFALYMLDGQNIFEDEPSFSGGWHLHAAIERLARSRHRVAPIVVGIDHGGEDRFSELSPFPHEEQPGRLDAFLEWLTGSLTPLLAAELPLIPGALGAVAGGSSMGGLASLYAHFRHPEAFGGALVMSPSFWLADDAILRYVADRPTPEVSRIYLDCGAREGRGTLLPLVAAMAAHLGNRGYDADHLMFRIDRRGAHNERSWRRRLPGALRFFYR